MSFSPMDMTIEHMAGIILENLPLDDDEINALVEEWNKYDFEIGQVNRMLAKLQRLAHDYLLKREGYWDEYRNSRRVTSPIGYLFKVEEG